MAEFKVRWEIEIDAETAFEAAVKALTIQRDGNSSATVFEVVELQRVRVPFERIDLRQR